MRQKKKLLKFLVILILYKEIFTNAQMDNRQNCGLGCSQCKDDQTCSLCNEGFYLNIETNKCINNICQEGLFLQDEMSTNNQINCKSMCSNNFFQSVEQRLCIKLEQCSFSYQSSQNLNINDSLIDIISYAEEFILLIYTKNLIQLRRSNGIIEYQTIINEDISSLQIIGNELIIIKDNSIYKWNLLLNKYMFLIEIQQEVIQQNCIDSKLLNINNQNAVLVYICEQLKKLIIKQQFTLPDFKIQQSNSFEIEYSSHNIIKFYKSTILQIGSQGIRIDVINYDVNNNNIVIQNFTKNKFICENFIFLNLKSVDYGINSISYFLIFDNSYYIYKLSMEVCSKFDLQQQPLKQASFNVENLELIAIKFKTSLQIFDSNLIIIKSFEYKPIIIIDFIFITTKINQVALLLLDNNSFIQYLNITRLDQQLQFNSLDQYIEVYIDNPIQLFYIPQISSMNLKSRLFITGNEVQSNVILEKNNLYTNEKQEYLITNYEFSYDFVSNKIISSIIIEDLNIFIACSQEGIFAWDIAHIYSPQILYLFQTQNDPCIEITYIKSSEIAITFLAKIMIIDVNYFITKQILYLNSPTSLFLPKITFQLNYGILIYDSSLFYYQNNDYKLTKLEFTDYNNEIQLISLQENDILIIQVPLRIYLYKIDLQNNKVQNYSQKQFECKIIKTKIRKFPEMKFEIVTYLENKTFLVIDQNLNVIIQATQIPLSSLIDIQFLQSDPNDDAYFILGKSAKVSATYQFEKYYISKSNIKPQLSFQGSSGQFILEPVKKIDSNNQIFYLSSVVIWLNTYSVITNYSFYPLTHVYFASDILQILQCLNSKVFKTNINKNYLLTDEKGYIGVNSIINSFYQTYYKLSLSDIQQNNKILQIKLSFVLNKVFIIKTKNILIFNIHTNTIEDEITFFSNPEENIQKYFILEQESVLIACKKGIILLKDFTRNKLFTFNDSFIFNINIYFKNDQTFILAFGTKVQVLKLDLTSNNQLNYNVEGNIIQSCKISSSVIVCQYAQNNQIIILFLETLKLKNLIQPINQDKNMKFYLDEKYNRIYLFSKTIEIYSYDGNFVAIFEDFTDSITDLKIFKGNIILILSSFQSYIRLYDQQKLRLKIIFTIPTTGNILSSLIVEEYNHLLISIDNIQFAQILVYSLFDLILYSFVKSTLAFNEISKVIKMIFDKDFNQLVFLDVSSNITLVSYKNLLQIHNIHRIYDFKYSTIKQPQGFCISFENNQSFVYNEEIVYQINYSRQTSFFNKFDVLSDNYFTKFPQQDSQTQSKKYYYILQGKQNTIYIYYDFTFVYFGKLKGLEKIKLIKYSLNNNVLVFVFENFFKVMDLTKTPFILNILIDAIEFKIETRYSLKTFLCQNIFLTYDNSIIHYDYQTMQPIKEIKNLQRISKYLCLESEQILVVGFIDGNSILYDLNIKKIIQFSQSMNLQKNHIKFLQETEKIIWLVSLNGSVISISKSSKQVLLNVNTNQKLNIQNQELYVFKADEEYHRVFVSYFGGKKIYCLDTQQDEISQNIVYLSFPSSDYNQIKITLTQVIFYSTFQLNIHDRISLKYLISIRRSIYYDQIVTLRVYDEQYYFILSLYKFELFKIDFQQKQVYLLDQIAVNYLQLVDTIFDQQNLTLKIIGIVKNKVFQETYNLRFYNKKLISGQIGCYNHINQLSFQQMTNQISLIKPVYQQLPSLLGQVEIQIKDEIRLISITLKNNEFYEINLQATKNSQLTIQAYQQMNNGQRGVIYIKEDLFKNFNKKELKLNDSEFVFSENNQKIQFNEITKNIYLQNTIIQNQKLINQNIQFYNKNEVILEDIILENLEITMDNKNEQFSFLDFFNCENLIIISLKLKNIKFQSQDNSFFVRLNQLTKVKIINLEIDLCIFDTLFFFQDIQYLKLNNLKITNCKRNNYQQNNISYFIQISAVQNSVIQNVKMMINENILFLDSNNKEEETFQDSQLINDIVQISDSVFQKNLKTYNHSFPQIKINATTINIINIDYSDNNSNIVLINTKEVLISNCKFLNNQGINGGGISFINNRNTIQIEKSNFQQNSAFGSGGALYFQEQSGDIIIDNETKIKSNEAFIGGGIRIQNSNDKYDEKFQLQIPLKNINDNKAIIYGQQFALNLQSIQISKVSSISLEDNVYISYRYLNESQLNLNQQQLYSGKLIVQGVKSGDSLQFQIKTIDTFGDDISFSSDKYIKNEYTQDIQNELSQYYIRIESQNQKLLSLNGQTIIKSESFSNETNSFIFKELQIIGYPNTNRYLIINYQINNKKPKPILVDISFKSCQVGEKLKYYNENIHGCQKCPFGTYSIQQFSTDSSDSQSQIQNQLSCQKCPDSAESCEGAQINLKQGFWRLNKSSDYIIQCKNNPQICNEQDTQQIDGCIEGHIGPLCEECDLFGQIWKGKQFSNSFGQKYKCSECSSVGMQVLVILFFYFFFVVYSLISTVFFMNGFIYTQTCYYLRQLGILPISKSSFKDRSSFCLKVLINYIQITSLLVKFDNNLFSQYFSEILNSLQSPSSQTINSLDCLLNKVVQNRIKRVKVNILIFAFNPIIFTLIVAQSLRILSYFKLFQLKSIHISTLINFMFIYFQPNSITYFLQSIVCRSIGDNFYSGLDLTIDCHDTEYTGFVNPFSGTILILYFLFPFYCFYQLRKAKTKLQNCITRYKYGFFYSEYKTKYYYWEFVRINLRILILTVFVLLNQNKNLAYIIIIFLIYFYIKLLLTLIPIQVTQLMRYEVVCFYAIIINIICHNINLYYQKAYLEKIFYLFHILVLFYFLLVLLQQKLFSKFNYIGKVLLFLLKHLAPKSQYNKFIKINTTDLKTFYRWKMIRKKISLLIISKYSQTFKDMNALEQKKNKDIVTQKFTSFKEMNSSQINLSSSTQILNNIKMNKRLSQTSNKLHQQKSFKQKSIFDQKISIIDSPNTINTTNNEHQKQGDHNQLNSPSIFGSNQGSQQLYLSNQDLINKSKQTGQNFDSLFKTHR